MLSNRRKVLVLISTVIALLCAGGSVFYLLISPFISTTPKELVDEVWQIVDSSYVDPSFNQQDWEAIRHEYLAREYDNYEEAYHAIRKMLKKLDNRYTRFLDPNEFRNYEVDLSGELTGVGIQLRRDEKTKELVVVYSYEDSPAFQAGILAKDVITKINDQTTKGMDVNDAVSLIRGIAGTDVALVIRRGDQELEFKLKRARIKLHPVKYSLQDSKIGKVGYIRLKEFNANAAEEMREAIQDLEKQQVIGYVLDLRSNPGGKVDVTIDIARMWLKEGVIVDQVDRQGVSSQERANNGALTHKPLVVLVDGDSASASELLAGALQAHYRATIVGVPTFGKSSAETIRKLSDGKSAISVSSSKFLTPDGRDIGGRGIVPNIEVLLTKEQKELLAKDLNKIGTSDDLQFMAALDVLDKLLD